MKSSVRLAPIYRTHGHDAVLEVAGGAEYRLRALDKTAGVQLGTGVAVQTIGPAAIVRADEMAAAGVDATQLEGAVLTLNGVVWDVVGWRPRPGGNGELDGEYFLLLGMQ